MAEATVPAIGATSLVAAFLATLGFAFRVDFFLSAFLADFFNDFLLAFFFDALFFFFFFAAFLAFLFLAMADLHQELKEQHTEPAYGGAGYPTSEESLGELNSNAAFLDIKS